jgi:hypothetical protein
VADEQIVIYRRPTTAGRTTYWTDNDKTGEPSRIAQSTALRLVQIGKARWFDPAPSARRRRTS